MQDIGHHKSYPISGKIWKVLPSVYSSCYLYVLAEEQGFALHLIPRDQSKKQFVYPLPKQAESWNVQMVFGKFLIVSESESSDSLQVNQLLFYDFANKQEVLKTEAMPLVSIQNKQPVFRKGIKFISINQELEWSQTELPTQKVIFSKSMNYRQGSDYFSEVAVFIEAYTNHQADGQISYLEKGGSIFISYYFCVANCCQLYLLVVDDCGRMVIHKNIENKSGGKYLFIALNVDSDKQVYLIHDNCISLIDIEN